MSSVQIDVKKVYPDKVFEQVQCNLYTGERCVKICMSLNDYENLISDGFFIRDGKTEDSAKVLNTTALYKKEVQK